MKQRGPLLGLDLTTGRYPLITSQTRYPLRHAASVKQQQQHQQQQQQQQQQHITNYNQFTYRIKTTTNTLPQLLYIVSKVVSSSTRVSLLENFIRSIP